MTDMEQLARRLVACPAFRWLPGMLGVHPNWRQVRVSHVSREFLRGACRNANPLGGVTYSIAHLPAPAVSDMLPVLTDTATIGCLTALVREAYGDSAVMVMSSGNNQGDVLWQCRRTTGNGLCTDLFFRSEAEALIAALEAAKK